MMYFSLPKIITMERREFIQKSVLATTAVTAAGLSSVHAGTQQQRKEVYEWRVYETMRGGGQSVLDNYFSTALIPALNRLGVKKVGAFSEMSKNEPTMLYLLIAYPSFEDFKKINDALKTDKDYQQASVKYNELPADKPAYNRYDSSLMIAFDGLPQMLTPASGPRMFELRTYEGYNEDAVRRKIKMFNEGEFDIFYRVKLNPVFFGEVIAGKNLPALTYMISFKNMEERDNNWKAFGQDPDWQKILKDPQYANTVSKIYKTFLEPLAYSQV
jgi:hypothetical protein